MILPIKELEKLNVDQLGKKLNQHIQNLVTDVSGEQFLLLESNPKFSEVQQILELRKYLIDIIQKQNKKPFSQGYLYLTEG